MSNGLVEDKTDPEDETDRAIWKGAVAGLAGGLVGSWLMNQAQAAIANASTLLNGNGRAAPPESGDNATTKAAGALSETLLNRRLTKEQRRQAGPAVHYTFGALVGGAYGAAAELDRWVTAAWGAPFGAAVWLGADEMGVPAFGLSKAPTAYPVTTHLSALAAHLVYGVTTDLVRRAVRAAI